MKHKVIAGLIFAGVLGISGTALADMNVNVNIEMPDTRIAKTQTQKQRPSQPPANFQKGQRPPMSGDKRPPMPPDGKHPKMSGEKRPPMPPRSGDRRPPEFDGKRQNRNNNR